MSYESPLIFHSGALKSVTILAEFKFLYKMKIVLPALPILAHAIKSKAATDGNPYYDEELYEDIPFDDVDPNDPRYDNHYAASNAYHDDHVYDHHDDHYDDHYDGQYDHGHKYGGYDAYDGDYTYSDRYHDDPKWHYDEEAEKYYDEEGRRIYYGGYDEPHHYYNVPYPQHENYESPPYPYEIEDYPPVHYEDDPHHHFDTPNPDFYEEVDRFNEWDTIWNQEDYESRLHSEAEILVSLEAMREALLYLAHDIDDVDYCVEDNDHGIEDNDDHIYRNS